MPSRIATIYSHYHDANVAQWVQVLKNRSIRFVTVPKLS